MKPKVLRLLLAVNETSAPYNQFTLAQAKAEQITLCSFFKAAVSVPAHITLYEGNGRIWPYLRLLRQAQRDARYDLIHSHSSHVALLWLLVSLRYPQLWQRTVHTIHSAYRTLRLHHKLMLLLILPFFGRIVACSRSSYNSFPQLYKWLGGQRFVVIQNGVDLARIRQVRAQSNKKSKRPFTIVVIGRLIHGKNPFTPLRAFQESHIDPACLLFIGDGPLRAPLQQAAIFANARKEVQFTGIIPRVQVYQRLAQADLFISASTSEGLPVAVLEAMACNVPLLLSDIPAHREIAAADPAANIPLFAPYNKEALVQHIQRLRQMSPARRRAIGERGCTLVRRHFSLTRMHAAYASLYAEVQHGH